MSTYKFILTPNADSHAGVGAKFTKGKRYEAEPFTKYTGDSLYKITDDEGNMYAVNPRNSHYIGGGQFSIELQINNCFAGGELSFGGLVGGAMQYPIHTSASMFGGITSTESPLFFADLKAHERDKDRDLESMVDRVLNMFGRDESRGVARGFKIGAEKSAHFKEGVKSASDAVAALGMLSRSMIVKPEGAKEASLADRVKELESELNAAHNTIEKIRAAMRTPEGEDAQTHAKVLRQMADALVSLWRDGK